MKAQNMSLVNPNGHRQHRRGLDGNRHRDASRALWLLRALPQAQPNYTSERRETAWQQPQHPLPKVTSAMHVCRPDMRHETRRPSSSTTRPRPYREAVSDVTTTIFTACIGYLITYAGKSLGEKLSRNKHRLDADGNPLPEDTTTSSDSTNIGKG